MLTIKCAKCKKKLFKYHKMGTGRVLKCYFARISHDQTTKDENHVYCGCGNIIGQLETNCIRMRQPQFIYTGTKVK